MSDWWSDDPQERYWLESTDRADIGTDLRAPLADSSSRPNWRYVLFRKARLGDVVFHYDGNANAITGASVIAGPPFDQPIVWAARGNYARERGSQPAELPGYAMPLRDYRRLEFPLTLEALRVAKPELEDIIRQLRHAHSKAPLYFPFELGSRPVRPMQGYAFKLPLAFVRHFALEHPAARQQCLEISSDSALVSCCFQIWRDALVEGARWHGDLWSQPEGTFVVRNQPDRRNPVLGARTALGVDPLGEVWVLQINEAATPGDPNVTAAIAVDSAGRPFLIRQGRLNANPDSTEPILYEEFAATSGLQPAHVTNGNTSIARDWYVVTPLDVTSSEIRLNTGRFVDVCAAIRRGRTSPANPKDSAALEQLCASDEAGGTYVLAAQEARREREVQRLQGEVWLRLAALLRENGIAINKPRTAEGYEVDAEIVSSERQLLVEIKTGVKATDVYSGLGQLMVYSRLLPSLAEHDRILLLPGLPAAPLVEALEDCNVHVYTYVIRTSGEAVEITFAPDFLATCGL